MNSSTESDQSFLNQLTKIVETNLSNNQFGVSELVKEHGRSRSYIHRKLKSETNLSLSQFIRNIRLKEAMKMLQKKDISAAEVAYDVGFSSPAYFNHCFHEYFGFPPGEVKSRFGNEMPLTKKADIQLPARDSKFKRKMPFYFLTTLTVILMVFLGIWYFFLSRDLSVIVLPFDNYINDSDYEYFADGIREDILNDLYRITNLRVVSRTSAEQFRNSNLTVRQIARKVKVKYVLEGSIRKQDENIRINVQLIDAYPFREDHIWSENFDRKLSDILGVQEEISLLVASKIKSALSENEMNRFKSKTTNSSLAYNYYLQARFLHHKASGSQRYGFDPEGVKGCIKYYEKAIAEDDQFAEAYAGLAKAWFNLTAWGILGSTDGFVKAHELSLKALQIDSDCAEAHCVLAAYHVWGQRKFEEGKKEFETSIRLNPNYATSRQWYAQYLMITGPIDEARKQVDIALELEPYFWVVQNLNSWIYYFEQKYYKSLDACSVAYDYNPGFSSNYWLFVLNYAKLEEGEKMKNQLQKIAKIYSGSDEHDNKIQIAFDSSGIEGLLLWMIETNKNSPIPVEGLNGHPFYTAWWYAISENKEETLYWLEKVLEEKYIPYHYFNLIATNPDFSFLRNESRYVKILEQAGLSKHYQL